MIVTGANGQLGRLVVEGLLARMPADRLVACVREPAQATALADRGPAADLTPPASDG